MQDWLSSLAADVYFLDIHKIVGRYDKRLNEYGNHVEKIETHVGNLNFFEKKTYNMLCFINKWSLVSK